MDRVYARTRQQVVLQTAARRIKIVNAETADKKPKKFIYDILILKFFFSVQYYSWPAENATFLDRNNYYPCRLDPIISA